MIQIILTIEEKPNEVRVTSEMLCKHETKNEIDFGDRIVDGVTTMLKDLSSPQSITDIRFDKP